MRLRPTHRRSILLQGDVLAVVSGVRTFIPALHVALPKVFSCWCVQCLLANITALLKKYNHAHEHDHECGDDNKADDGTVVASKAKTKDGIEEAKGDSRRSQVAVNLHGNCRLLCFLIDAMAKKAQSPRGKDHSADDQANDLMGICQVGIL